MPINLKKLKRLAVIGVTCSGKTTFARKLAQIMGVKHIELEAIYYLPKRTPRPTDEFRMLVWNATAINAWVMDGSNSKVKDIVLSRATTVILLKYPWHILLSRALHRLKERIFDKRVLYSRTRQKFRRALMRPVLVLFLAGDSPSPQTLRSPFTGISGQKFADFRVSCSWRGRSIS